MTASTADTAREFLRRTAELATRMTELGARCSAAAVALAAPGIPAPDELVKDLGEAGRAFATLRAEVLAAATALDLEAPALETIDSTRGLAVLVTALIESAETAERRARAAAALARAVDLLDHIAALAHRDDPVFAPLAACQSRAADVRAALATTDTIDPTLTAPFTSLLLLMDGQAKLDDEQWGMAEDAVAAAFGRALAVAASRGKLVRR